MKALRIAVSILAIAVSFSLNAFVGTVSASEQAKLTLKDCLDLALKNNGSIILAQDSVEDARLALEQARANDFLKPSPVALRQAETAYANAQSNLNLAKLDLALTVEQQYYDLLKAEDMVKIASEALQLAQEQLNIAMAKKEAGVAADLDVLKAKNQVSSAQANLGKAQLSRDIAMFALNQTIGLPVDTQLSLVDQFSYEPVAVDLEEATKEALSNRVEITQAQAAVELADMNVKLAENDYTPKLTLARNRIAASDAAVKLKQQQDKIVLAVRQAYVSLKEAESRITLTKEKAEESKENLRITQLLYNADMATSLDVLAAQNAFTQAEIDALEAIFDYNVAKAQFWRALGRGQTD